MHQYTYQTYLSFIVISHFCNHLKSFMLFLFFSNFEFYSQVSLKNSVRYEFIRRSKGEPKLRTVEINTDSETTTAEPIHSRAASEIFMPLPPDSGCLGLFVRCHQGLSSDPKDHVIQHPSKGIMKGDAVDREIQDLYLWPWVGKMYSEGYYKCTGVLVDYSWLLIHNTCASELR